MPYKFEQYSSFTVTVIVVNERWYAKMRNLEQDGRWHIIIPEARNAPYTQLDGRRVFCGEKPRKYQWIRSEDIFHIYSLSNINGYYSKYCKNITLDFKMPDSHLLS